MRVSHLRAVCALAAAVALAACSDSGDPTPQAPSTEFHPVLPMRDLMVHVFQHAAYGVWRRQGRIYSAEGETSLFPQDAAGWEDAEEAAATLAELTNVLLLPPRKLDDGKWAGYVHALREAAIESMWAAEDQAEEPFFEAGGQIQAACEACHDEYLRNPDGSIRRVASELPAGFTVP